LVAIQTPRNTTPASASHPRRTKLGFSGFKISGLSFQVSGFTSQDQCIKLLIG
jgi:hypothetical protein